MTKTSKTYKNHSLNWDWPLTWAMMAAPRPWVATTLRPPIRLQMVR